MLVLRFVLRTSPISLAGIALDISDRVKLEQELRAAVVRKREFLATVAHELRNPLAPIVTALNILEQQGGHTPDTIRLHDVMRRQAKLMAHLIDDLMDAARVASGKIEVRPCATNLVTVLKASIEISRPLIEAAQHKLHCHLPHEALPVVVDARRITQVVTNLLNNSAKYTPAGGEIALEAERKDGFAEIRVKDNGIGIRGEMLEKIFDLFAQGDRHEHVPGGLGVGLALVKTLVQLHHGEVFARSDGPGTGCEFVVRLPLLSPPKSHSTDSNDHSNGRILIVDDNRDAADSLAHLLRMTGDDAEVAYDGDTALRVCEQRAPSIVLLDLMMPGMDGYAVARKLRESRGAGVIIVGLTAASGRADRDRMEVAGFDFHLIKPVELDSVRALFPKRRPAT
jgi:CheY-like chemotaxis protein/nitrogen-specific signal transduction histidine kinase